MVKGMQLNILIRIDIIIYKGSSLDFVLSIASFRSCSGLTIPIMAQAKPYYLEGALVYATKAIILGPYTKTWILVKVKATLQEDHDFIFELTNYIARNTKDRGNFTIYTYLVNYKFLFIKATNRSNKLVIISWHACLETLANSK
jgi:hypothetical protein